MDGSVGIAQDHKGPCQNGFKPADRAEVQRNKSADEEQYRQLELIIKTVGKQPCL